MCGDIETHIIGVYDGGGDSTVILSRPGKHVLVLSAYQPTTWHVQTAPGAEIEHIYAVGYHEQHVVAKAGLDVITESHDTGGAYADGYRYPDPDTDQLMRLAAKRIHHDATSFHGCYYATQWEIGADLSVTSDCHTEMGYQQADAVPGCDADGGDTTCGSGDGGGDGSGSGGGDGGGGGSGSGDGVVLY